MCVSCKDRLPAQNKPDSEGGYTVIELMFGLIVGMAFGLTLLVIYTGAHFIHKLW